MAVADPASPAVDAGLAFLAAVQEPSGEIPSFAGALTDDTRWEPDRLNFVSALTSLALAEVDHPAVAPVRERVASHLLREREPSGLWRYWAVGTPLHDYTPPDADDTACCSLAAGPGSGRGNVALLLANRDRQGRFYTWFVRHPDVRSLRHRWGFRSERTAAIRARRQELWANSEASPDDVDVTVNANVIRYLGAERAPAEAIEWVASVIEAGTEVDDDHWYRSRTSLYRSVAVAAVQGIDRFAALGDLMVERLAVDPGPGALRSDLERADALRVLRLLGAERSVIAAAATDLLRRQHEDGSWERSICYYGGPQESFGWASEALTTATAVSALYGLEVG
jgi:hypothetical protein